MRVLIIALGASMACFSAIGVQTTIKVFAAPQSRCDVIVASQKPDQIGRLIRKLRLS